MTLDLWLQNGWLKSHETTAEEIPELLAVADRNLADVDIEAVSADARMGFAHAASIAAASAALAAAGYRVGRDRHHERLIDSMSHTVGADIQTIKAAPCPPGLPEHDDVRTNWAVTEPEAGEAVGHARLLVDRVRKWLTETHPKLAP